ncbi:MAG: four-helix bundle copper-binding protein [Alphaproteobacteria bacterium]|nr:four-helix bundle copper-binding protein [Alphaproteobacteria bacterium]
MIYKNCIDACFDCVKACDRCSCEGCDISKDCGPLRDCCVLSAEVCNLVGRLTARGICCAELYDICAKICDDCAKECSKVNNEYAKACAEACKKCAETCRACSTDCKSCDTKKAACH